jgi:hypothetical protein
MQTSSVHNVWRQRPGSASSQPFDRSTRPSLTPEQTLFLKRLNDLIEKRRANAGPGVPDDWRRRLIDKALYSTFQDCLGLDIGEEARARLRQPEAKTTG